MLFFQGSPNRDPKSINIFLPSTSHIVLPLRATACHVTLSMLSATTAPNRTAAATDPHLPPRQLPKLRPYAPTNNHPREARESLEGPRKEEALWIREPGPPSNWRGIPVRVWIGGGRDRLRRKEGLEAFA